MADSMFCNAPERVTICKLETNLCCVKCEHNESCRADCRALEIRSIPCRELDEEGDCEFLI